MNRSSIMRIVTVAVLLFLLASTAIGCNIASTENSSPLPEEGNQSQYDVAESARARNESPDIVEGDLTELVASNTTFAFDLYHALREEDGNLFYSPYSISLALALTYAGAKNDTEQQISDSLHFTLPQDRLHHTFNALDLMLASRSQGSEDQDGGNLQLNIANSIWGQQGYEILPTFLDVLAVNYGTGLSLLDFEDASEESRVIINDWVSDQTEGKIEDLIPEGSIDTLTRLVLTNAIYFDGAWKYPFEESLTRDGTFNLLDGSQVTVPMMKQTESFNCTTGDEYMAVELPYVGDDLSMVIFLPDIDKFEEFENSLDAERACDILNELSSMRVQLTMPRFSYEGDSFSLKTTLVDLGISDMFSDSQADLSGIDGTRNLFIQDVVHKAFIEVNEVGTEAAAATGAIVGVTSMPPQVTLDRPFVYMIRDTDTGSILFMGRVLDPS